MKKLGLEIQYSPTDVNPSRLENFTFLKSHEDPGVYDGPLDENGKRCGVGTCKWADSKYEGEWLNNLRHGNGKYTCSEYEYLGEWQYGMRHGRCKF